jgi:hypothetical protein
MNNDQDEQVEDDDIIELPKEDADKLKKFIEDNTSEEEDDKSSMEKMAEKDAEGDDGYVPRDQIFDPYEDGLSDLDELPAINGIIEVTEQDKQDYLRAVLNDEPVVFKISLCGESVKVKLRARTAWEQSLVYEAVFQDQEMKIVNEFRQGVIQLQKYSAVLMVQEINGRLFSNEKFEKKGGDDWQKDVDRLRELVTEKIDAMDGAKLTLILNALRIFEFKLARIGTQCLSGNFWNPVD